MAIVVDTGPLFALADASDAHHSAVAAFIGMTDEVLVVPISVLPEVCYLVNKHLGPAVEAQLVRSVAAGEGGLHLENLTAADLVRAAEVLTQYADARLGFVDASVVAVAERLRLQTVLTLDRRHFGMVRPRHCAAFTIVP